MNKLSEQQEKDLKEHCKTLEDGWSELQDAVETYNSTMRDAWAALKEKLDGFNESIVGAEDFRSAVHDDMETHYNERSDRWQASDAGEQFKRWMDQWDESLSEIEFDEPDGIEMDGDTVVGVIMEFAAEADAA